MKLLTLKRFNQLMLELENIVGEESKLLDQFETEYMELDNYDGALYRLNLKLARKIDELRGEDD